MSTNTLLVSSDLHFAETGPLCSDRTRKKDADFDGVANLGQRSDHDVIDSRRSAGTNHGKEVGDSMSD